MIASELHITLIDDHPVLLDGITALLKAAGYDHITALSDPDDIAGYIDAPIGGILILDINIGSYDGLEVLSKLSDRRPELKVIMLSSYADARLIREALKRGAKSYLSKQTASAHVAMAIEAVAQGSSYFDPIIQEVINKNFAHMMPDIAITSERPMWSMLSDREKQVLELIRAEYTSEEIAKELYISKSTVDTYRKNLIIKMKVKNSVGLAKNN